MANVNTFAGYQNLPAVTSTSTAAFGYKVPASGLYAGLPSPNQIAGNVLTVSAMPGDIASGGVIDQGRPFRVRLNGQIKPAQSEAVTIKLYQVTGAVVAAGFTAATGTGQNQLSTTGAETETAADNFVLDTVLIWDSASKLLNGYYYSQVGNQTFGAITKITQVTGVSESDLNFYAQITFGTTGTGDVFGPFDFTIDRF